MIKKFFNWLSDLFKKPPTPPGIPLPWKKKFIGEFTLTYYWNAFESADRKRDTSFTTEQGRKFQCSREFKTELEMEGMGFIDGQWIGYWNKKFHEVPYPMDARGNELMAEHSIAVSKEINLGDHVTIGDMPTIFEACDTGSAIKNNRIDIYIFSKDQLRTFENRYGQSNQKQKVYKA